METWPEWAPDACVGCWILLQGEGQPSTPVTPSSSVVLDYMAFSVLELDTPSLTCLKLLGECENLKPTFQSRWPLWGLRLLPVSDSGQLSRTLLATQLAGHWWGLCRTCTAASFSLSPSWLLHTCPEAWSLGPCRTDISHAHLHLKICFLGSSGTLATFNFLIF